MSDAPGNWMVAFALVYLTFFLDNVLLTVLVPIIPDWVRGPRALAAEWGSQDGSAAAAPLARLLNATVQGHEDSGVGGSAAVVGAVLSAIKAVAQVCAAGPAGAAVCARGPPAPLRAGTALLLLAATLFMLHCIAGVGGSAAVVGAVLSAKAVAQLCAAGPAGAAVCARGPPAPLRAGTALLLLAATVFACCSYCAEAVGAWAGLLAGAGRAAHGAGAALCGVAGLSLTHRAAPPAHRDRATAALLGAVALGVLVGYPFGGVLAGLWQSPEAPFIVLAVALLLTLFVQYKYLQAEEFNQVCEWGGSSGGDGGGYCLSALATAREGSCGVCAGAVLLTTAVMAALEPCLPLWIMQRFHPQKWVRGAVFIPDSAGYVVATSVLGGGGAARALGAERLALAGQVVLGLAALALPHATSVAGLGGPHVALGAGLGAVDAALVPALLARRPAHAPRRAALLQAAASAAYVLGPLAGGLLSAACSFPTTLRALGVLNLIYAAYLYRALKVRPLSKQWGALSESEEEDEEGSGELRPLRRHTTSH